MVVNPVAEVIKNDKSKVHVDVIQLGLPTCKTREINGKQLFFFFLNCIIKIHKRK
jgi:hypothetical protein